MDLVNVGEDVEKEKDALLEAFFLFARGVCGKLDAQGHWADYIDPCSGLPMVHKEGSAVYGEVRCPSQPHRSNTVAPSSSRQRELTWAPHVTSLQG